jgi:hypothetical protein
VDVAIGGIADGGHGVAMIIIVYGSILQPSSNNSAIWSADMAGDPAAYA